MNKHCFPEEPSEQTETNNKPERSPVSDAGGKFRVPREKPAEVCLDWKSSGHTVAQVILCLPNHRSVICFLFKSMVINHILMHIIINTTLKQFRM